MYSQNREEEFILNYFNGRKGTVLDIGANDGKTLSNSFALIQLGWGGVLVEPDEEAFEKLLATHSGNHGVCCYNFAISDKDGEMDFYKSGTHLNKGDTGLLSTTSFADFQKWVSTTTFTSTQTVCLSWDSLLKTSPKKTFEFITIDAEGQDWNILKQIDLLAVGCEMICIEHNGIATEMYKEYCEKFRMKEVHRNAENIIMAL